MIRRLLLFPALLLSTTTVLAAPPRDAALLAAIQGVWCHSTDGGKSCVGLDEFDQTTVRSCGRFPDGTSHTSEASVAVQGSRVCLSVTGSSRPDIVKPGREFCVDVLSVNDKEQRYRNSSGAERVLYRADKRKARCPGA